MKKKIYCKYQFPPDYWKQFKIDYGQELRSRGYKPGSRGFTIAEKQMRDNPMTGGELSEYLDNMLIEDPYIFDTPTPLDGPIVSNIIYTNNIPKRKTVLWLYRGNYYLLK